MSAKTLSRRRLRSSLLSSSVGQGAFISATTGSPTASFIAGWAQLKFTADGTFTVSTPGLVMLEISGGGGGGSSSRGGGAGGQIRRRVWLEAGTYTVTVGAAGTLTSRGGDSRVGDLVAFGGGSDGDTAYPLGFGGSSSATASPTGKNVAGQGNVGATGPGGGGGAGGAATGTTPSGVGGVGVVWLDGNTYGVGGSEAAGGAGGANTGNGGQGLTNDKGGSGVVTVSTPI